MSDTKESHYQDRADLEAELAHARAAGIRLQCELAEARKSLDALRAAPSDAEIEAWRKSATRDPCKPPGADPDQPYACGYWLAVSEVEEAVALMRRASAAPAQSAREDVCAALDKVRDWFDFDDEIAAVMWKHDALSCIARVRGLAESPRRCDNCGAKLGDSEVTCHQCGCGVKIGALAAAPEAKEPSGVGVPDEVHAWASGVIQDSPFNGGLRNRVADWILSLPTPAAALDDTRRSERAEVDGELQPLLSAMRDAIADDEDMNRAVVMMARVVDWLARKAGAK